MARGSDAPRDDEVRRSEHESARLAESFGRNSAVAARPGGETTARFRLRGCPNDLTAAVLGESRTVAVKAGILEERFSEYQVHLYRLPFAP